MVFAKASGLPDVRKACEFYMSAGFWLSEYIMPSNGDFAGVFLQRKGNPHDIVFAPGAGPRFHHVAFSIPESYQFFYVCDLASNMGFAENIEFGPGRHGPGHALFVYMRDPDGHRIELFNTHYQVMDIENEPVRWNVSESAKRRWQLPARRQWFLYRAWLRALRPRLPGQGHGRRSCSRRLGHTRVRARRLCLVRDGRSPGRTRGCSGAA